MLTSAIIENFRGIERLTVEGLGRVTLIIGKNDAGKTALMEALWVAAGTRNAGFALANLQIARMGDAETANNFDEFWRPIFRGGNAERGFRVQVKLSDGASVQLTVRKVQGSQGGAPLVPVTVPSHGFTPSILPWSLEYEIKKGEGPAERLLISSTPQGTTFPQPEQPTNLAAWITTGSPDLSHTIGALSLLKQHGRDGIVRDLLKQVDGLIEGVELLSLTGGRASVFVRIAGEPTLLPLRVMGEGIQRCFDIAVILAVADIGMLSIDEIENGLHHGALNSVWKWLAKVSAERGVQVFATTHSEECVYAACQAFADLRDDGLKVIRLDRREHETVANVYDRNLVEAAERMGTEIRG